ncbi:MAG: XRE family transcriptional regulator [Peptococcaceae bacterium BRH_c4b]|nr:MAG: XRE family transcriptional regulator [Peptococcaceae bacterium BRH_c4b]
MKWSDAKRLINSNPEVLRELKENEVEYQLVREMLRLRQENNLTQKDLAELVHTRQSNISRLESGTYNPSVQFLDKIAKATGKKLKIEFI